jgi:hypothetical protein
MTAGNWQGIAGDETSSTAELVSDTFSYEFHDPADIPLDPLKARFDGTATMRG